MTIEKIKTKLIALLPNKHIEVSEYKFLWTNRIVVDIARSNYEINGVRGQYIEHISFYIEDGKITFQVFGGNGWSFIYRKIDKDNPKEKYNALGREKIKTRNQKTLDLTLEKVCKDYLTIVKDISERWLSRFIN